MLPPTISGATAAGSLLGASTGTWFGTTAGFDFQWFACYPSDPLSCFSIDGATSSSYTPPTEAAGYTIFVRVIAHHPTDPTLNAMGSRSRQLQSPLAEAEAVVAVVAVAAVAVAVGATTSSRR